MKRKKTKIRWLTALVVMAMFVAILPCRVYAEEDGSSGGTDPSAPKVNNTYTHTYHTNVKITANVTEIMHDGSNSLTSETQVQKESGFIEGSVSSETVQAMITSLKNEIRNQYNQAYSSKETVTSTKLILDHFESANIVTDARGDTITDKEDLKKILDGDIVNLEEKYRQNHRGVLPSAGRQAELYQYRYRLYCIHLILRYTCFGFGNFCRRSFPYFFHACFEKSVCADAKPKAQIILDAAKVSAWPWTT